MSSPNGPRDELIGGTIAGRYRIISALPTGGMGVAYRAWDARVGVPVVVKLPKKSLLANPKFAARFLREIRVLQRMSHPHIVPIVDVGEHGGRPFFVMPFLPGGSLADRKQRDADGRATPNLPGMLHLWLPGVAAALDAIHALPKPVVHRDVKPSNIFFDAFWHAYLGDFGIAKVLADSGSDEGELTLTEANMGVGTPEYMAPEQFDPDAKIDGRADQYALAVVVYEMLAGSRPFTGTMADIVVKKRTQSAPSLHDRQPGLPASLAAAVHRGLARQPAERFATCAEFAAAALRDVVPIDVDPETARLLCPKCESIQTVPRSAAGRTGKCRNCQTRMQVANDLGAFWLLDEAGPPRKSTAMAPVGKAARKPRTRRWLAAGAALMAGVVAAAVLLWPAESKKPPVTRDVAKRTVVDPSTIPDDEPVAPSTPIPDEAEPIKSEPDVHDDSIVVDPQPLEPEPSPKPTPSPVPDPDVLIAGTSHGLVAQRRPEEILASGTVDGPVGLTLMRIPAADGEQVRALFYMSATEVTNRQWNSVMHDRKKPKDDDLPVVNVTWEDANAFCERLSERPEEKQAGRVYRLPTAQEWVSACKAGKQQKFWFGDRAADLRGIGWSQENSAPKPQSAPKLQPVGKVEPNPWGLRDMHGNAWEWSGPGGRDDESKKPTKRKIHGGSFTQKAKNCGSESQAEWAPDRSRNDIGFRVAVDMPLRNSIGIEFALIEPGEFTMGSGDGEKDDRPEHRVTITKPFCLGVTEVTNAQWKRVMGEAPPSKWPDDDKPVTNVTWADAVAFCAKLSALPEEKQAGRVYRLPTEAEWEYACGAGAPTKYSFGNDPADLVHYGWFGEKPDGKTHPVRQRKPNSWGLYDMHGNVWEWCSDYFTTYTAEQAKDPHGLAMDMEGRRVCRGGSFSADATRCTSAVRVPLPHDPRLRDPKRLDLGFRLALSVDDSGDAPPAPVTLIGFNKAIGETLTFSVSGLKQHLVVEQQTNDATLLPVYGGNPYTADAPLAVAAVHAGVVAVGKPGIVRVTIFSDARKTYGDRNQNGIQTFARGPVKLAYRIEVDDPAGGQPAAGGNAADD